jgi:hypothetical protein
VKRRGFLAALGAAAAAPALAPALPDEVQGVARCTYITRTNGGLSSCSIRFTSAAFGFAVGDEIVVEGIDFLAGKYRVTGVDGGVVEMASL